MNRWGILLGICSAFLAFCATVFAGNTITVGPGGPGAGYDYATIQEGIDAAVNGDTVVVAEGTYTGDGNRDVSFGGKAITVRSSDPNDATVVAATVIDCQGSESVPHRAFYFGNGEGAASVLAGIKVKNGYGPSVSSYSHGGGIYCSQSSPTITKCVITNCTASDHGGGIYVLSGNPKIANCTIMGNYAQDGSGIWVRSGSPEITCCTVSENQSSSFGDGGGICLEYCYDLAISKCIISDNTCPVAGGGISFHYGTSIVTNCIVSNNTAGYGGGVQTYQGRPRLINCVLVGNYATRTNRGGGAIETSYSDLFLLTNCTIKNNGTAASGGGLATHNGTTKLDNCIIWGNTAYSSNSISGAATVTYSDIEGGYEGIGNINQDPCFAAGAQEYHINADSPCIDAGNPDYLPGSDVKDIDDEFRLMGSAVDMGSDEFTDTAWGILTIGKSEFFFHGNVGDPDPESQVLSIINSGGSPFTWQISQDCPWLEISSDSGSCEVGGTAEVELNVNVAGLDYGQYNWQFDVVSNNGLDSPQTVTVTLLIHQPEIDVSTSTVEFKCVCGTPGAQTLQVSNSGGGWLRWSVSDDSDWLEALPTSGVAASGPNEIQLVVDCNGLGTGRYSCQLTISDSNAINSPVEITVHLSVVPMLLSYGGATYAYAYADMYQDDDSETDTDSSSDSMCQSRALAGAYASSPCPPPQLGYVMFSQYSGLESSVGGSFSPEGTRLESKLKGWGEWSEFSDCSGTGDSGTGGGEGNGYSMLAGSLSLGVPDGYQQGMPLPTMTVRAAVGGSNPGSWDNWDWWVRIWRDDPCTPLAVLNDANMADNLEVFAGETLYIDLYHEAGDSDWPISGLSSIVQVVMRLCSVADLDIDGYVDLKDYGMLASQWQQTPGVPSADIAPLGGGDGKVDSNDLLLLAENWLVGVDIPGPLPDPCSCVSYWSLDDGAGSVAVDSIGESHGIITGASWAVGQVGWWSLEFDGDEDRVVVPDDPNLDFGSGEDFSISLWFRIGTHSSNDGVHLVNKRENGGDYQGYVVFYEDRSDQATYRKVGLFLDLGSSGATVVSDSLVDDGAWHHLVVEREGTTLRLYLDGAQEGGDVTGTGYDADLSNSNPLIFGMNRTLEYKDYYGWLDEIMIYRKALTVQEVGDLYQYGLNN